MYFCPKNMAFSIRKAELKDAPSILELIQELATFEREPDAVKVSKQDIESLGFGTHPLFECWVATLENDVVGMALFYPRFSTWKGPTLHLEDLIVNEAHKGKGIGTALYRKFIEIAAARNLRRIEWVVLDWNTPAVEFYQKSGAKVLEDWCTVQMDEVAMQNYLKQNP